MSFFGDEIVSAPFYELAELAPYSTHLPTQKQKVGREFGEKKKDSALEVAGEVEDGSENAIVFCAHVRLGVNDSVRSSSPTKGLLRLFVLYTPLASVLALLPLV